MRRLFPILILALVAAGCGALSDDPGDPGQATDRLVSEPVADGDVDPDAAPDDGADAPAPVEAPSFDDDHHVASVVAPWEGACSIDEVPVDAHHVVFNIPADDPDGGLNLRDFPGEGDVVRVLPEGEIVRALDCLVHDDGGVWWLVEDRDLTSGFVNAAYLTADLSGTDARPRAASEAEEHVEWLLTAMAAGNWPDAAEILGAGGGSLLAGDGNGWVEPSAVEEWCDVVVCDAPWEIVGSTGTYAGGWDRPTVDVRFDHAGGPAVQTFTLLLGRFDGAETDGLVGWLPTGIVGLPGRSAVAFRDEPVAAAALAVPEPGDAALLEAAEEVRAALLSESGPRLPVDRMAPEGVVFSLDAYVSPEPAERVSITPGDLGDNGGQVVLWGFADGTGYPVVDTVDGFLGRYRRDLTLLRPDEVAVDERLGQGNTIANLAEVFPEARVVEYHRQGRGELADFNWSSLRMAFEPRAEGWTLVAVASDTWTI